MLIIYIKLNCLSLAMALNSLTLYQESLDNFLLGHDGVIITLSASLHPYIIPREMGQLAVQNFQALREFEDNIHAFRRQHVDRSVREALLSHFDDTLMKVERIFTFHFLSVKAPNFLERSQGLNNLSRTLCSASK